MRHGLQGKNAVWTRLPANANVGCAPADDKLLSKTDHTKYRSTVGELLYIAVCTRPHLPFSLCALARQIRNPTVRHAMLLHKILRYLVYTRSVQSKVLFFKGWHVKFQVGCIRRFGLGWMSVIKKIYEWILGDR